ncbi:MAG: NAD(P)-dependent alcohol dehydrogenase [Hydrocarboniphaga sp.]|uniref:NAD(P)-dependent alcohol dehydrogenase n=1 Tax=Hydrocarboniphaga sp. TaxID=2033016 RepID=UPI0026384674|nr:NAD(P)-dependent alcohol dehydrogenase [Hydrocarboniphaga sp.]MDB5971003.1 NAD(P)-dependent alcohol dehydrogenase [Hydrocarboniphaga sp.]
MITSIGYAATQARAPLLPFNFERRDPGEYDVVLEALFCGVCHSDLHAVNNDWGSTRYPLVPGHEIVGKVVEVGSAVTRFKIGDHAGIGCLVDSCRECAPCHEGDEHFCECGATGTYGGFERGTRIPTYGGYSNNYVVAERFALTIPQSLDLAAAAPLLCAGITTYSPLRHWRVGPGQRVGIVGLGGLGHMGLKIAKALGAVVVLFSTSESKREDGLRLGADEVVISSDPAQMKAQGNRFDFILDTVSAEHDINAYLRLLKRDSTMCLVGLPEKPTPFNARSVVLGRKSLAGSFIGGLRETQEMLDFCAEHGIVSDIEMIDIQQINEAYARLEKADVKYRFVIDLASLKS